MLVNQALSTRNKIEMGSSLSVDAMVRLWRRPLSLWGLTRWGSGLSAVGRARQEGSVILRDAISLGTTLSVRCGGQLGSTMSLTGVVTLSGHASVQGGLSLGSSLSLRSFVRVGSSVSVRSSADFSDVVSVLRCEAHCCAGTQSR